MRLIKTKLGHAIVNLQVHESNSSGSNFGLHEQIRSEHMNEAISYNFPWPWMKTNSEALKYTQTLILARNRKLNKNSALNTVGKNHI